MRDNARAQSMGGLSPEESVRLDHLGRRLAVVLRCRVIHGIQSWMAAGMLPGSLGINY